MQICSRFCVFVFLCFVLLYVGSTVDVHAQTASLEVGGDIGADRVYAVGDTVEVVFFATFDGLSAVGVSLIVTHGGLTDVTVRNNGTTDNLGRVIVRGQITSAGAFIAASWADKKRLARAEFNVVEGPVPALIVVNSPKPNTGLKIGDTFTQAISIENRDSRWATLPVSAWQMDVLFNPLTLEVLNVTEGDFLEWDSEDAFFAVETSSGKISVTQDRTGQIANKDPTLPNVVKVPSPLGIPLLPGDRGTLLTITFRVLAVAEEVLGIHNVRLLSDMDDDGDGAPDRIRYSILVTDVLRTLPSLSAAEVVFRKYSNTFRHPDVYEHFPDVLLAFKNPDIQNVLNAVVINHFVREPGYIRAFYPDIDESLVTLLTTDDGFRMLFEDEEFQDVLQDPAEIDELVRFIEALSLLDPEILALEANFLSITERNPDSGAPQGTVTISAYTTAQRTAPQVTAIRLSAGSAGSWEVKTSTQVGGRIKWSVPVNTMTLPDTITKADPGARNAVLDNRKHTVRAVAIGADGTEWPSHLTARFSVDNVDDVPPVGPTTIVSVADADGVPIEVNEDGSYTVGGFIDEYDETLVPPIVKFTVEPAAKSTTYDSVILVLTDADGIETFTEGIWGQLEFTVNVGEFENGTYMFHALAVDAVGNIQTDVSPKITVHVENHERPAPEIVAITVDPAAETNPDSGAPQGTLTLNSYSRGEQTTPPITSMIFEVKRQDADDSEWKEVGKTDFSVYNAPETTAGGEETASIHPDRTYQKWWVSIDTIWWGLEDTIDAESLAARDVSLDANPYVVRAIAVSAADGSETVSSIGVKSTFSLDNVDDVAPLGPTNIVAVADVAGPIDPDADGTYTVGGIVDETVESPIAIYIAEPTAHPSTYASIRLVQVDAGGNETMIDGEVGMLDITTGVGMLENGTYRLHALAVDEFGNVQTDESPQTTVNVLNFRVTDVAQMKVTAVDSVDVLRTPSEPIPLQGSLTVGFNVDNGSLDAEELSGAVNGSEVRTESAENPENTFSLKVDVSALSDGTYTPHAVVTKRNGSVGFRLKSINLDVMVPVAATAEGEIVPQPEPLRATTLNIVSGNDQTGEVGEPLAHPFVVEVLDQDRHLLQGIVVTFSVTKGNGQLSAIRQTTNAQGQARTQLTLGSRAGTHSVTARAAGIIRTRTFTATAIAPPPPPEPEPVVPVPPSQPEPEPLHATMLNIVSGNGQSGEVGKSLAQPFVVGVLDQDGKPLQGIAVTFTATAGEGRLSKTSQMTNVYGQARTILTLGPRAGLYSVTAYVAGITHPQTFTAIAIELEGQPTLNIVSGNGQSGEIGKPLAQPFVVKILDQDGKPLQRIKVTFVVTAGEGWLSAASQMTNVYGQARTILTLGPRAGLHSVTARAAGITQTRTFIATATAPPSPEEPEPVAPERPSTEEPNQQLPPVVYWIEEGAIFRLDGGNKQALVEPSEGWTVTSLAMDMEKNKLYWTERQTGKQIGRIWSGDLNDRNARELRRITAVPEGIVVDAESNKLYWTNDRGKIQRISVDGKNFKGDFIKDLGSPHHIALDLDGNTAWGDIYWTVENGDGSWSIWGVPFDGRITKKEIMSGLGRLGGIAVDGDKLYWTEEVEENHGEISSAYKNGAGNKILFSLPGSLPLGLAVDEAGRRLYWTDNGGNIRSLNLDKPLETEIVVEGLDASAVAIALGRLSGGAVPASPAAPSTIAERSVENALLANYPNPFNPETWIPYQLSEPADVLISIYSVNGHLVRHLDLGHQVAGVYQRRSRAAYWDGRNEFGERVASGLYFYTLTADDFTATRKMLIRK